MDSFCAKTYKLRLSLFFCDGDDEDGHGVCRDHKEPIDNQLGMVFSHQALPMASPFRSSASNSLDLDAKTDK